MNFERSLSILILFSPWLVCKAVAYNCITWDVIQDDLNLIYRTDDFIKPVTLKDNNGNKTRCSFEKTSYHCHHIPMFGVINPNINKKEIKFTIEDVKSKDVEGTWYISQGGKTFSTTVSLTNGFIRSTDIYITGEVNISKVTVRCFACRAPYGKNAEFLINDRSEDSLTLNSTTGKCTHQAGECNPEICSCSLSGNEFSRSFYLKNSSQTVNFSCDMMFVDRIATSWFSKYATLLYDGTDVHSKETKTNKKNSSDNSKKTKDYAEKDFTVPLIGDFVLVIVFITVVVVIVVYKKSRTKHKDVTLVLHRMEEAKPLCSSITQSCRDLQSLKADELAPQLNNPGEKYVFGKESTQAKEIVQKSDDQVAPPLNNQVDEYVVGNYRTQANETVQTSEDQLAPQMNNQDEESVIENDRTQANETVQTSEEELYIDRYISKQRSNSPTRPFDVIFINFDVNVERQWVERVVGMLEEKYDLVCGLIGRDFLCGIQMDNSFHFIKKHTPVVVTFSEMSCIMKPVIRLFENIDKLVVVMVEECSPPIFGINMRCVDATMDEENWIKQLFTALEYQKYVET
ncbi:unnamed protein product [Mytilus coruscus]|uniref:TIR domain-containing protein n=1 Tax=Mytilus coruscus TaxID=42192 RepID=A0A6J8A2B6_MYTCO|nr:unnamed protein product [Mytilus coruscus]